MSTIAPNIGLSVIANSIFGLGAETVPLVSNLEKTLPFQLASFLRNSFKLPWHGGSVFELTNF